MLLQRGTRLGPYVIEEPIGQGGMGEVYRGTDSRLGRSVAIKVMPELVSDRADRRTRFQREAKAVSQLNHPNICTLHDVGEESVGGSAVHYLVMELLDGETLADRISRGPLPLDQVIRYGMDIAAALDVAHRAGIVHRDLKPGNVMVTASGVKLLDFGLAKTLQPPSNESAAPTMQALTAENALVGTLQYMAPEQLSGGTVDARTDIFALGAVLYEMVSGSRAFSGATQASIIAAIIHDEPRPLSQFRTVTPPSLDRIITMCLAKDPEQRWQNARDVMLQLRSVRETDAASTATTTPARRWGALAAAALLGALGGAAATMMVFRRPVPAPAVNARHVTVEIEPPLQLIPNGFGAPFAISPDASRIVWVAMENSKPVLFTQRLDRLQPERLAGTEGASSPFFSPDGQFVAFFGRSRLRLASVNTETPVRTVAPSGPGGGGTWIDDHTIVFAPLPGSGLQRLDLSTGKLTDLTTVDAARGEASHSWPNAIRGTQTFLFTIERDGQPWDEADIGAFSLDTGKKTIVLSGGTRPHYAAGRLFFTRGSQLMEAGFDPQTMKTSGSRSVALDNVVAQPGTGGSFFSVAADGSVAYLRGGPDFFCTRVVARAANGTTTPLDIPLRTYANPRLSHDGTRLAVQVVSSNDDVWVFDRTRRTFTRVTAQSENLFPEWSPDDKSFLVTTFFGPTMPMLATVPIAGSLQPRAAAPDAPPVQIATSWSSAGRIAFTAMNVSTRTSDIYVLDSAGGHARPFLQTRFEEHEAAISPDGRLIAYCSDESGASEVYLRAIDQPADKVQLSVSGGREPLWSHDGRRVYFRNAKAFLAVDVTSAPSLSAGTPQLVFEGDFVEGAEAAGYDVGADDTFVLLQRNAKPLDGMRLHVRFAGR